MGHPWVTCFDESTGYVIQTALSRKGVLKAEISKLYKRYGNLIVTLLKKSKQNYFTFYFIEHQNNAKKPREMVFAI